MVPDREYQEIEPWRVDSKMGPGNLKKEISRSATMIQIQVLVDTAAIMIDGKEEPYCGIRARLCCDSPEIELHTSPVIRAMD